MNVTCGNLAAGDEVCGSHRASGFQALGPVEQQRVGLELMDVRDAEVADQPAQTGADAVAVRRRGARGEVGNVGFEDVAEGPRRRPNLVEVDTEDGEDLASRGES